MFLSNTDIRIALRQGEITIDTFEEEHLQPASYDVHLYPMVKRFVSNRFVDFERLEDIDWVDQDIPPQGWVLMPNEFIIASTVEAISVNNRHICVIDGSSTYSRSGFTVHQTGQWGDPGFHGTLNFECKCTNGAGILLRPGMKLGQVIFARTLSAADPAYAGRYQDQKGPQIPVTKKKPEKDAARYAHDLKRGPLQLELLETFDEARIEAALDFDYYPTIPDNHSVMVGWRWHRDAGRWLARVSWPSDKPAPRPGTQVWVVRKNRTAAYRTLNQLEICLRPSRDICELFYSVQE